MTFQVPPPSFSGTAATGLGIYYPSIGKPGVEEGNGGSRIGSNNEVASRQRTIFRTESIYDADISAGILGPSLDPFSFASLLVNTDFLRDDLDLMSDEPVIEPRLPSAAPPPVIQEPPTPVPTSVDDQGRWVLRRILDASGHTVESLAAELKVQFEGPFFSRLF
jgi:hypothetical protein